jgi:lipoate-protein ligase A
MAIDEAIALACRQGHSPTTLRFYTWNPPALSVGYFQNITKEVNLARCKAQGYGFVRRPTGGKAVLHDQELTYSITAKADNPLFPRDLHGCFLVIARAILCGLHGLGIEAEVFGKESPRRQPHASRSSQACFATALGFEIGVEGKKLIGSAQRRWRKGFLQHGSILIEFHPENLFDLLKFPDEEKRKQAMDNAVQAINSLSRILQKRLGINSIKEGLIKGFEETLNIRLIPSQLTSFEVELAQTFVHKKYGTSAWNLHRVQVP